MTQLVVGLAGAFAGSFFGPLGTQIGWALGTAIAAPTQRAAGPRLTDLKITGSAYGDVIPWIAGHPRTAGQLWWSSDRREISTTTEQGKGGGVEYTEYTYEVDMLIGLSDVEIAGVSRIWDNGKLVWTKLLDSGAESALNSKAASKWRRLTVYTGAADQLPDPTYETAVGVGYAPAYRGRGSVFIEGLQLGQSGQLPNLTFEVYTEGNEGADEPQQLTTFPYTLGQRGGVPAFGLPSFTQHLQNQETGMCDVVQFTLGLEESELLLSYSYTSGNNPQAGNSDVSGQFLSNTGSTAATWYGDDGIPVAFTLPYNVNDGSIKTIIARRGSDFILGSNGQGGTNTKRIYRYSTAGGTASTFSVAMTQPVRSITIAGSSIYAVDAPGSLTASAEMYVLDLSTLSLQNTIALPAANDDTATLMTDEVENVYLFESSKLYRLDGTSWTLLKDLSFLGSIRFGQSGDRLGVFGGDLYGLACPGSGNDARLRVVFDSVSLTEPTIQEVVESLCARAGMSAGTYDATALSSITKPVRAVAISQLTSTRVVLEQLASAWFFESYAADKLYFVPRGGSVALTIDSDDLGAGEGEAAVDALPVNITSDSEIAAQVALSYANADADYNTATEQSDRLLTGVVSTSAISLPMAFTSSEAKGITDAILLDGYASRIAGEMALPVEYTRLVPTDVVLVTAPDGTQYRARLVRRTDNGLTVAFEWVLDDPTAIVSAGVTSDDYTPSLTVQLPSPTTLSLLDIPILRDADDAPGIYAAMKPTGTVWPGATLFSSVAGGEYANVGAATSRAIFGTVTVFLTDYTGGNVFDEIGSVTVDVGAGTLSSATRDDVLNSEANAMLVGDEVIQFRTATLVTTGVYKLTGLLRGRRGTEWAMTGHAVGERAVLLRTAGLVRVSYEAARIGLAADYKAVTLGKTLSSALARSITDTGIALKPFAPVNLRVDTSVAGVYTITWDRRTRLAYRWPSVATVPIGEASESYVAELYDAGDALVETQELTGAAVSFSSAVRTLTLDEGIGYLNVISGAYYGIQAEGSGLRYVLQIDSAGTVTATSFSLGDVSWCLRVNGGQIFATGDVLSSGTPQSVLSSTIYRIDPADITTVAASYTMPTAGDAHGIWHDGTSLWVPGYVSGDLRELNGTTLASIGTTLLEVGIWAICGDGTYLFITNIDTGDVFAYDPGVGEVWRVTPGSSPFDILVRSGFVYVACADRVVVLNAADGTTVATHTATILSASFTGTLVNFGSYVCFRRTNGFVAFIDATTGAIAYESSIPAITYLTGADGSTLFTIGSPTLSFTDYQTWGYSLNASLAGFSVNVYQVSATVGRGYVASITL